MSESDADVDVPTNLRSGDRALVARTLAQLERFSSDLDDELAALVVALLGSSIKEVSRRAAGVLANAASSAPASLLLAQALDDPDPRKRWGAAFALSRAGRCDAAVARVAVDSLCSGDGDVRWAAAEIVRAAACTHEEVVTWLRELSFGPSATGRKMALYCLRDLACLDAELFSAALEDGDREVRLAALSGLAGIGRGGEPAIGARLIARMSEDPDSGVRRAAAAALGRLLNPSVPADERRPITAALERARADASDPDLRRAASQALKKNRLPGDEDDG